jgi:hypothetical protein
MPATAQTPARQGRSAPVRRVAFTAAAHEHTEPAFDVSFTPGAASTTLGPFDIPAYGFMRHLLLLITTSGGTAGPGVLSGDGPWNVFQDVQLLDVNGGPIFGAGLSGFDLFLTNLYGGYVFSPDPRKQPDANVSGVVTFTFAVRVPIEINHNNGLGALPNQNSAANYKLRLATNPSTTLWTTPPTTPCVVRVRGYLEAWSQPSEVDLLGRPQEIAPPALGTTQYWSKFTRTLNAGQNTVYLPRVGNYIRNLVYIVRDGTGVRRTFASGTLPDPIELRLEQRSLYNDSQQMLRARMYEKIPAIATDVIEGIDSYSFCHDVLGHLGDGTTELFLPTFASSRLESVASTWAAGTVEILTNDVAPAEISPSARYDEYSSTGYQPAPTGMVSNGALA